MGLHLCSVKCVYVCVFKILRNAVKKKNISPDFTIINFPSNSPSVFPHTHVNASICLSHSLSLVLTTPSFLFTPSPLSSSTRSPDSAELFCILHDLIRRVLVSCTDASLSSTWQPSGLWFFTTTDRNRECFTITNYQTNHKHLTQFRSLQN